MADVTVDNGALTDYVVDAVELSDTSHVQTVHLVTAVEAGAKTDLAKAEDAAHASGDMGIQALAVRKDTAAALAGTDGDYTPLISDSTGRLHVTPTVSGDVAHDAVDSGNPIKAGAKTVAHGANPTAVAAADRTDLYANRHGVLFTIGGHPNVVTVEAAYTAAQTDAAIVTVATGLKIVVISIAVVLDEATTVGVGFRVGFGATTTPTTTGVVATHPGMVPGSGLTRGDGSGILGIGADGEDLRITSEVPTSGSLRVNVSYYTVES